ncbi:MAG: ribosome modulation factor [Porticoccaceae bacterium]
MKRQKRDSVHRAFVKGYQLGFNGRASDHCPHQDGTVVQREWFRGWQEGREDQWQGYKASTSQHKVVSL